VIDPMALPPPPRLLLRLRYSRNLRLRVGFNVGLRLGHAFSNIRLGLWFPHLLQVGIGVEDRALIPQPARNSTIKATRILCIRFFGRINFYSV